MVFANIFTATNFTALYKELHTEIMKRGLEAKPRGMPTKELLNVNLVLLDPRDRLLFSDVRKHSYTYGVAEFMWYLRGSDQLSEIAYYLPRMKEFSDDGETLRSSYGHRIFGRHPDFPNQWENVKKKLIVDNDSRQAIVNINYAWDQDVQTKDVPCTLNWHFVIRENALHMFVQMRSNDSYMGLIYDVYSFSLFHEMMYNELKNCHGMEDLVLGAYVHKSDSMHCYARDFDNLKKVLEESTFKTTQSPIVNKEIWNLCVAEIYARKKKEIIEVNNFQNPTSKWMATKLNIRLEKELGNNN